MSEIAYLMDELKSNNIFISLTPESSIRLTAQDGHIPEKLLISIKQHKDQLVKWLQEAKVKSAHLSIPRQGSGRVEGECLTPMQQSLWLTHKFEPDSPAYNIPVYISIEGNLDVNSLLNAIKKIVQRHEILRVRFGDDQGLPFQSVSSARFDIEYCEIEPSQLPETMERESLQQFDLSSSPLFVCKLLKLNDQHHVLLLTMHHIISDGWSCGVMLRELEIFYTDGGRNLEPLPFQYRDYSYWYANEYQPQQLARLSSFWRGYLQGAPVLHSMPIDFPRPSRLTSKGAVVDFTIPSELVSAIGKYCKNANCSKYLYLFSAYQILLHKYSGADDIVVGTPAANRGLEQVESLIGYFVNVLPARSIIKPTISFREFVSETSSNLSRILSHQGLSLDKIVDAVSSERSLSYSPIFQTMFSYQQEHEIHLRLPGLKTKSLCLQVNASKYDLVFNLAEEGAELQGSLRYCTELFSKDSVKRFVDSFVELLQQLSAYPDKSISDHSVLSQTQAAQLRLFNQTKTVIEDADSIHQSIERCVAKYPGLRAVTFESQTLTYLELNRKANQLAHHLRSRGYGPGSIIGICMERSVELVVSLLAILKCGAAYVPLDPGYPIERINYMAEDAGLTGVIISSNVEPMLADNLLGKAIVIDGGEATAIFNSKYTDNPEPDRRGDHQLAYIIYTSGSTGRPKGVKIGHASALNLFTGLDQKLSDTITTKDESQPVWLAITSISFDISVLELFWTLSRGFHVIIQPEMPVPVSGTENLDFSLFYFAAEKTEEHKYRLLLEGAKFADTSGLTGIWVPERHFHSFGDQFPNPAIAAGVVGALTKNIKIRAGSVVVPLHDPIRIVEEWSMVDHFSAGRVEISVASGWHPNDFIIAPENFESRHQIMRDNVQLIKDLWGGASFSRKNGVGKDFEFHTHPKPIQQSLPLWVTAAGNPETFRYAGSIGAGVLTHFLGQDHNELKEKIAIYHQSLIDHGFSIGKSRVALMLHTFLSDDLDYVEKVVKDPFTDYIRNSIGLFRTVAEERGLDLESHKEEVIEIAYQRYFNSSGLFGTPETCLDNMLELIDLGVTEICCLIDFGIPHDITLANLPKIVELKELIVKKQAQKKLLLARHNNQWQPDRLILEHGVTHVQCTPSYVREWAHFDDGLRALAQLQAICVGGEPLDESLANHLVNSVKGKVFNMYGPTETTVWSAVSRVSKDGVVVGGPLANTVFYVLDKHLCQCPIGVPGELYIGGAGLFLEYHNRPELTRTKKLMKEVDGQLIQLYQTGDLVKWRSDGNLVFLGRMDNQVKLRGFRIELGEIENLLLSHLRIDNSVVIVWEDTLGHKKLVAYILLHANSKNINEQSLISELQQFLRRSLPDYMVPEGFVFLDAIPLTPNRKIDRKALPPPNLVSGKQKIIAPVTSFELKLYNIWQDILRRSGGDYGIDNDFFSLGGNSLLAIQLISRIKEQCKIVLSIRDVFECKTIRLLAERLGHSEQVELLPLIRLAEAKQKTPATYVQKLFWFVHHMPGNDKSSYNVVDAVRIKGSLNLDMLKLSLTALMEQHDCLRSYFSMRSIAEVFFHVHAEAELCWLYEEHDFTEEQQRETEITSLLNIEQKTPFDLVKSPLFRARLVKLSSQDHVLIWTLHHIVADGWAQNLIRKEISENYQNLMEKGMVPERTRLIHYSDYASCSVQWHEKGLLDKQLDYWQEKFISLKDLTRFPVDTDNSLNVMGKEKCLDLELSQETLDKLQDSVAKYGVTLYSAMLTIFKIALFSYSDMKKQVVSTFLLGRARTELESSIGQYADSVFIVSEINTDHSLVDFCKQIRNTVYESQENSDISGVYVRQRTGRDLPILPMFFNFVDLVNTYEIKIPGAITEPVKKQLITGTTMVGLEVDIRWSNQGLRTLLKYNSKLFNDQSGSFLKMAMINCAEALLETPEIQIVDYLERQRKVSYSKS